MSTERGGYEHRAGWLCETTGGIGEGVFDEDPRIKQTHSSSLGGIAWRQRCTVERSRLHPCSRLLLDTQLQPSLGIDPLEKGMPGWRRKPSYPHPKPQRRQSAFIFRL